MYKKRFLGNKIFVEIPHLPDDILWENYGIPYTKVMLSRIGIRISLIILICLSGLILTGLNYFKINVKIITS